MTAEKVLKELETQVKSAKSRLNGLFAQWDTSGLPSQPILKKMTKDTLVALIVSYHTNPPSKGKKPLIGDTVKMILEDKNLDLIPKSTICELIRNTFNSRGMKCGIKNLDWYPSAHGYFAIPRRSPDKEIK